MTALAVVLLVAALGGGYAYTRAKQGLTDWQVRRNLAEHKYGEARATLREKLRADPNNAELWVLSGKAALAIGDMARAEDAFSRAFSLDRRTGPAIGAEYFASGQQVLPSDPKEGERRLRLAANYDASLSPKIGRLFLDKARTAYELHDTNSVEALFETAVGFDSSLRTTVAQFFADATSGALDSANLSDAERYAKDAVAADPAIASKTAQVVFDKLSSSVCDLQALGRPRFDATMKVCADLGLPDTTKHSISYRLAYALQLYETPSRPQAIDILSDISHGDSKACTVAVANYLLKPPAPGRIAIPLQPQSVDFLTIQLLYVDVSQETIKLTFSFRANSNGGIYIAGTPAQSSSPLLYLEDDNGRVLNTTTGWIGGRREHSWRQGEDYMRFNAGEAAELSATFPMITRGAQTFTFVSPQMGGTTQWTWPSVRLKRDVFPDAPSATAAAK